MTRLLLVLRAVALWSTLLVGAAFILQLTAGPAGGGEWSWWGLVESLSSGVAILVPFAAFAGGVAARRAPDSVNESVPSALGAGLVIALLSYGLSGVVVPVARYQTVEGRGLDVQTLYPFGPETPGGLWELRQYVIATPPAEFSRDVEQPLQLPPNWFLLLLLQPAVLASFAVINTGFGLLVGAVTTGLSPPARRHARWAIGLAGGIVFFVAMAGGASWVREDAAHSAILGAGLPLMLPVIEILAFLRMLRRRGGDRGLGAQTAG